MTNTQNRYAGSYWETTFFRHVSNPAGRLLKQIRPSACPHAWNNSRAENRFRLNMLLANFRIKLSSHFNLHSNRSMPTATSHFNTLPILSKYDCRRQTLLTIVSLVTTFTMVTHHPARHPVQQRALTPDNPISLAPVTKVKGQILAHVPELLHCAHSS